jgi:hypothetical protein
LVDCENSDDKLVIFNSFSSALIEIEKEIARIFPLFNDDIIDVSKISDNQYVIFHQLLMGV